MVIQLKEMIADYVKLAIELRKKSSPLAALMGNREDAKHPAHAAFYEDVRVWTEKFSATEPGQPEVYQALELLLLSAKKHDNTAACWYLIAIQGLAKDLIQRLDDEHREALLRSYEAAYPRNKQLPLQKEIFKLLGGKKERKMFRFL